MPAAVPTDQSATDRRMMVDCQLRTYDITDHALLAAFDTVPREDFVAESSRSLAYADCALPTRALPERAMLPPMVLARMIQALDITPGSRVLDVAGGAGYGAAILVELGARVTALETVKPVLPAFAGTTALACAGPLAAGHAAGAPYDAILLHGAVARNPSDLIGQLRDGGRLVCGDISGEASNVVMFERFGTGQRKKILFDATLPALAEFATIPGFVF